MIIKDNSIVVFDLDDTLYKEVDFLISAYKEIARFLSVKLNKSAYSIILEMVLFYKNGSNTFKEIIDLNQCKDININDLISIYRNHSPKIKLSSSTKETLNKVKKNALKVGLITDGRSIQQRNKIQALKLSNYFNNIIISEEFGSEKPNINNYKDFMSKYGNSVNYIYIGDNTKKDFISPNKLGWTTVCLLDNGKNIHKQSFSKEKTESSPDYIVTNLIEILE